MRNIDAVVKADGTLDASKIWRREPMYQGMNGQWVERIYLAPGQSYIFKPLTNGESADREAWVYRNVLAELPEIPAPMLLAASPEGSGAKSWAIFEDLGQLNHTYRLEYARAAVRQLARLHAAPVEQWPSLPAQGPKPGIAAIAADVLNRREEALAVLGGQGLPVQWLDSEVISAVRDGPGFTAKRQVLSHGDLHQGNYAVTGAGRVLLLDWEHAHRNLPYWDLYHLIDMSHPRFPKVMPAEDRMELLETYLAEADKQGTSWVKDVLIREYAWVAAIFSLWMLLLIEGDLRRGGGVWTKEGLLRQREETAKGLAGCLELLENHG
ncbi:phosphotransferase family protein [Paenibacillus barengoltzii]|uniref:phosphotransferase family protein n=1 Tax=Paenibacillus barengoltzii TaxID=343517 RepID=UPI002DBC1645|nr:aminoglycoside phosphotransferase family protein [Paenibacillus barengoltzii]MEC2342919.1 aminoglycoside phosphotransferase family protein [Paenibacillus barengoltzii]